MEVGHFIEPKEILFMAAGMAGDKEFKVIPEGFYTRLIEDGLQELKMESIYSSLNTGRADYAMPTGNLTVSLPKDCFDVRAVYVYSGDACTINNSRKLWFKRNYYTRGNGYIANDKGNNAGDPYLIRRGFGVGDDKSLIRVNSSESINNLLFYGLQAGNLMISSSCLSAGTKLHVVYGSTGCEVKDAPIIPIIFKSGLMDYVTEASLRFRMANEPSMIRVLQPIQIMYERRLGRDGFTGSWPTAIQRAKNMSTGERTDLATYMAKGAWATGR